MGLCGPSFDGSMDTQRRFPEVFAEGGKRFHPAGVLCRPRPEDETLPARIGDAATPPGVQTLWEKITGQEQGTDPACGAARSAVEGGMSRVALYPGSFDPVTNGHLDVVKQAVRLCDRLIVAIGVNSSKTPLFSTEERLAMVRTLFTPVAAAANCIFDCTTYDKLTVTAAQKHGATIMIRGLRDGTDLDFEMQIAGMNETMAPEEQALLSTVFLIPDDSEFS
jgi:pantetheine-phosphate adenylyltransferase